MNYKISDLIDIPKFQVMLDSLYVASGIPTAIIDVEGNILTACGWQDICTKFHRINPDTEKRCIDSDSYIGNEINQGKPYVIYKCQNGLVDSATRIIIDGNHLANTFTGQLFLEDPDMEYFRIQAQKFEFDEKAYLEAVRKVPVITEETMKSNLAFLSLFTEVLAESGLKRLKEHEAEEQLRQSQKMEVIGTLAGGVAHDFNNILSGIMGYSHILSNALKDNEDLQRLINNIIQLSEKAGRLTKSLLLYSRKQVLELKPVDINNIINDLKDMLIRIIGEDIDFRVELENKSLPVLADSVQLDQALLNLVTNARDAMPKGGKLTLTTQHVRFDERHISLHGFGEIGQYALITVTDTGTGMSDEIKEHIFDPFFTTKEVGSGTGLGLSMVYGTVKQLNGYINLYSELGLGTAIKIYLPITEVVSKSEIEDQTAVPIGGNETILIAEDDMDVRNVTKDLLQEFGYRVIEAVDGEDALKQFKKYKDSIKLLVLDVIMPKKTGKEIYESINKINPGIKAIFTSGYTADILTMKGVYQEGINFISKPVIPFVLLRKIREFLDSAQ